MTVVPPSPVADKMTAHPCDTGTAEPAAEPPVDVGVPVRDPGPRECLRRTRYRRWRPPPDAHRRWTARSIRWAVRRPSAVAPIPILRCSSSGRSCMSRPSCHHRPGSPTAAGSRRSRPGPVGSGFGPGCRPSRPSHLDPRDQTRMRMWMSPRMSRAPLSRSGGRRIPDPASSGRPSLGRQILGLGCPVPRCRCGRSRTPRCFRRRIARHRLSRIRIRIRILIRIRSASRSQNQNQNQNRRRIPNPNRCRIPNPNPNRCRIPNLNPRRSRRTSRWWTRNSRPQRPGWTGHR